MADMPPPKVTRIESLDVLRGLAVLGILAVNAESFAMPWPWSVRPGLHPPEGGLDGAAYFVVQVFFQTKFISLFSMLFGVSIFLVGGEAGDPVGGPRLRRRLLWLAVIGLIHGALIWYGDVLLLYAIAGLAVMPARSWPPRVLIAAGGAALAAFGTLLVAGGLLAALVPDGGETMIRQAEAAALADDGGYRGGFVDSLQANVRDWGALWLFGNLPSLFFTAPLMLIGLGLFKAGVFTGAASPRLYAGLLAAGTAFLALVAALASADARSGYRGPAAYAVNVFNSAFAPLGALAYVALIVPRVASRRLRGLAGLLAPVGRMALTNYLAQSVIMTALFYGGRGPGLFSDVERGGLLAIAAAVWAVQILWSRWWLDRFAYGPMEWLWRSLTDGRAAPFRNRASVQAV